MLEERQLPIFLEFTSFHKFLFSKSSIKFQKSRKKCLESKLAINSLESDDKQLRYTSRNNCSFIFSSWSGTRVEETWFAVFLFQFEPCRFSVMKLLLAFITLICLEHEFRSTVSCKIIFKSSFIYDKSLVSLFTRWKVDDSIKPKIRQLSEHSCKRFWIWIFDDWSFSGPRISFGKQKIFCGLFKLFWAFVLSSRSQRCLIRPKFSGDRSAIATLPTRKD